MGRFNLLREAWIPVITENGENKEYSLLDVFRQANRIKTLSGDMPTQSFAILRILEAVLQTVFTRYDGEGRVYEDLELNDLHQPSTEERDEILEDGMYSQDLLECWKNLWRKKEFPAILYEYLEDWEEHFYLFDEEFPFFQVREEDVASDKLNKAKAGSISGKNINRLISESGNKTALFSPRHESMNNKDLLNEGELTRWLITFQSYTGLSDKTIFGKNKYKASKGWLFDIGGLYFQGSNLYDTLLLNLVLKHPEREPAILEKPCWEYPPQEVVRRSFSADRMNNLSELYTAWSRAIYIDPETKMTDPFSFDVVKLPDIDHVNQFLEPMTLWRFNQSGENKGQFTPRKHQVNRSLWRSFGLLVEDYFDEKEENHQPGIMQWYRTIQEEVGDRDLYLVAISMESDGNATSWVPVDEIYDYLLINSQVLADMRESGWMGRIYATVEKTKKVISTVYGLYIRDVKEIRNISSADYVSQKVEELYYLVDQPFRDWLGGIRKDDDKEETISKWYSELKRLVKREAEDLAAHSGERDYRGIVVKDRMKNIATAFNSFMYFLNEALPEKEEKREPTKEEG
ncbi:type I-E CRISPR-associated protein Cse1/CasA [Kallipyga massiliensis]|uniref:type I-E CRISPR-associated protein Cse1/CasA n=1 Tax=Kallipyga massiliensis TaxID=1472764 RepID=UPI0026ED16E7|nr:type I-E CRISPR-associated protein Cse1/CasA [Kallipyga massiliensis]